VTAALVLFVAVVLGLTLVEKRKAALQKTAAAPIPAAAPVEAPAAAEAVAPAAPEAPPPIAPATLNKLFTEAEKAFAAKDYKVASEKLTELLGLCRDKPEFPIEMLMFNHGLAHLMEGKGAEAEKAFGECLKKFPQGEYASRCHLGIGKAAILQGGDAKKKVAIDALKKAAVDPKFRSEAGLALAQSYIDDKQPEEALTVLRSLIDADAQTPQQTAAAVEILDLLAEVGPVDDLKRALDRLSKQPGVHEAIAWYSNQIVVKADALVAKEKWEAALAIYQSVPARDEIVSRQTASLEKQKLELEKLKLQQEAEAKNPGGLGQASKVGEAIAQTQAAIKMSEEAKGVIEGMKDFDAALLMRRGRCLYYLERQEEALTCFSTIREKHPAAEDAQTAAYTEIVIFNELKDNAKVQELAEAFATKYPKAPNLDQVTKMKKEKAEKK
jgi:tetratricopeptide (TPR) repeat protein